MKLKTIISTLVLLSLCSFSFAKAYKYKNFIISRESETDNWTIEKYEGAEETVVIPATINKAEVVIINKKAFAGNTTIQSVEIPATVKTIKDEAFANCSSLKSVKGDLAAIQISSSAFLNTPYSAAKTTVKKSKAAPKTPQEKYQTYLNQAKKYEAAKQWVFALNYYYEACMTDLPNEEKTEAGEAFKSLAKQLESGNPGYGEFNIFQIHDEWKKIIIDFEKLWIYYSPVEVEFYGPTIGTINYEEKTATCVFSIDVGFSAKFAILSEIIKNGYESAYRYDWKDIGYAYYIGCLSGYGVSYNTERANITNYNYGETIYAKYKVTSLSYKFRILDNNNKVIFTSDQIKGSSDNYHYYISNVSPDIMTRINKGELRVDFESYELNYSELIDGEWVEKTSKPLTKPLSKPNSYYEGHILEQFIESEK